VSALLATIQVRVAILAARILLAPRAPAQRLLPFEDRAAVTIHRGLVGLAWLYGIIDVLRFFLQRFGLPREPYVLVMSITRVLFAVLFLQLVWRVRGPIARLIQGDGRSMIRRFLAELWPALMTAYVLGLLAVLTVEQLAGRLRVGATGLLSLLVVIAMPMVDMALCRLIDRRAAQVRRPGGAGTQASFVPVLRQGVHILVTAAGILVLARTWNLNLVDLASRSVGARVAGALIDIGLTLMLASLVWQLAKTAIDQRLECEAKPQRVSDPGEIGGMGASRLRTLLPLARGTVFAVVCVMSAMTILAALGVNIGPLVAGAGVVGLAVGFGAQTLVRDIISGAFYLMDDAFRLGEYINVGDAKGTVEKIGIRSMQLRHHRGPLNVVPYGGIRRMTNESRDWVIEKLEFRLTYDADLTKVKKIIKRIGQELKADPDLGPTIIEPLKSQGVLAMEDSAMLVRAKFIAIPGQQFVVRIGVSGSGADVGGTVRMETRSPPLGPLDNDVSDSRHWRAIHVCRVPQPSAGRPHNSPRRPSLAPASRDGSLPQRATHEEAAGPGLERRWRHRGRTGRPATLGRVAPSLPQCAAGSRSPICASLDGFCGGYPAISGLLSATTRPSPSSADGSSGARPTSWIWLIGRSTPTRVAPTAASLR
jgi:small-conductance mechanosensitive channel